MTLLSQIKDRCEDFVYILDLGALNPEESSQKKVAMLLMGLRIWQPIKNTISPLNNITVGKLVSELYEK